MVRILDGECPPHLASSSMFLRRIALLSVALAVLGWVSPLAGTAEAKKSHSSIERKPR